MEGGVIWRCWWLPELVDHKIAHILMLINNVLYTCRSVKVDVCKAGMCSGQHVEDSKS